MLDKYPYTNFHEMNLDWIIKEMKDLVDSWDSFSGNVSATAHVADTPEVSVSGDLKSELVFDFGLVRGNTGARGPQGIPGEQGPEGPAGKGLEILDVYPTLADLQNAHPTGNPGDAYLVRSGGSYLLYIWSSSSSAWTEAGTLSSPSPSVSNPLMDGNASAGSSVDYARADHVHPKDTSKLDVSNTDGVYAVENGTQTMLDISKAAQGDALVQYASDGSIAVNDLTAVGAIYANTLNVTNDDILNSARLESIAGAGNDHQPLATTNPIDPLILAGDQSLNTPSIKFTGVKYDEDGVMSDASSEVHFTNSFNTNSADYAQSRIGLAKASSSVLGGIKAGRGVAIDPDGTANIQYASLANIDLNDVTYNFSGYVYGTTNYPPGTNAAGLLISSSRISVSAYRGIQLYSPFNNNKLYLRSYTGVGWTDWHEVITPYVAGESVSISNTINVAGDITGANKKLNFTIPLDRPHDAGSVTFTHLYVLVRGSNGYQTGSSQVDLVTNANYSVSASLDNYGIYVSVDSVNAMPAENNTPVVVDVRAGTTFTFA